MLNKKFSERLNKELDVIGVPTEHMERINVFAKLIRIPKFKAETLISGIITPNDTIIHTIAQELEVNEEWLLGKTDTK